MNRRDFLSQAGGALVIAFSLPVDIKAAQQVTKDPFAALRLGEPQPSTKSIDTWLKIDASGRVTVFTGKVELGTGVRTALTQLVADELDVAFENVQMIMGDTTRCPDQFPTVGSITVFMAGPQLRAAAAEARLALVDMAAARLNVNATALRTEAGHVVASDRQRVSYASLIGDKRFEREFTGKAKLKTAGDMHVIGKPIQRVELPAKVCGTHDYVHNWRVPGMLHGRVLRPPIPGAKLKRLDASTIEGMPGHPRVVRKDNVIGLIADNEYLLNQAVDAVKVEWHEMAPLPDQHELPELYRRMPATDVIVHSAGEIGGALNSQGVVEATYQTPHQLHGSIGPSCAVADVRSDGATLWCGTQMSFLLRDSVAEIVGLPKDKVRLIWMEGSGCYGQNGNDDCTADAALLSQLVGKPVRVQWTRQDEHLYEPRGPAMLMSVRAAVDSKKKISAWDYQVWSPSHANARPFAAGNLLAGAEFGLPRSMIKAGADRNAKHSYTIPNQRVVAHFLHSSPIRTSSLRALGGPANTLANECFMDELAAKVGVDPLDFRLAHLQDERAIAVLEEVARMSGWREWRKTQGVGRGLAFAQYDNYSAYVAMVVQVQVSKSSGGIRAQEVWVAHDCGLVVNPDGVRNQIEGNVIQTLSRGLYEEAGFTPRQMENANWASYPIMRFSAVPSAIHISLIDRPNEKSLGAGEPASAPVFACLSNAIHDAVGVRLRTVPFTAERIKAAISSG